MSKNYAAGTPMGNNQMPLYHSPAPFKAIARYYAANGAASSVITLTENTTAIEIAAQGAAVVMKWVSVADGTGAATSVIAVGASANFDHAIPAGNVRRFVVPIEVQNNSEGYGSVVGANIANGLFRRVAYKVEGAGSVLATEYGSSNSY